MLRDKYDYLILYYSGGSDSWTVLNTFLENNIKLDCVYVRWPFKAENSYTPNTVNQTAYNFMSEWDFVIKKDLEWLAQEHPEIRIETADWMEGVTADCTTREV
jgi:diphthamide synthase (EF-2-diphthine--ammonia ligase)